MRKQDGCKIVDCCPPWRDRGEKDNFDWPLQRHSLTERMRCDGHRDSAGKGRVVDYKLLYL